MGKLKKLRTWNEHRTKIKTSQRNLRGFLLLNGMQKQPKPKENLVNLESDQKGLLASAFGAPNHGNVASQTRHVPR